MDSATPKKFTPGEMSAVAKALAARHGFSLSGMARVPENGDAPRAAALSAWISGGLHGPLEYMPQTEARRRNLRARFPWARTVLCLAAFYDGKARGERGRDLEAHVARYARGRDYHRVFEKRLKRLSSDLIASGICAHAHYYTDTGPVLERAWAEAAGLGWAGKNTCLIHPRLGSYMLLAEVILDCAAEADTPLPFHCGTCRRCIDACPTQALECGVLDSAKCLVTYNIELNGRTPRELWEKQGQWAAGCDICQEVCPYNAPKRIAPPDAELAEPLPWQTMTLAECMVMDQAEFDRRFVASTLRRTGLKGLRLGAITAAGNCHAEHCVEALRTCLEDGDEEIRARAEWAVGQFKMKNAKCKMGGA
ncbi:MAG TPA: tRNA epoxyqueuosine(34) reductase QueG [Planctomycetota bacterium]|nr:tRNA epoxyqueuosine(34) reductase QueG [Planctomycetota bacterium]